MAHKNASFTELQEYLRKDQDMVEFRVSLDQLPDSGLEITAGQRTMSRLIVDLTGQTFALPVMLTGQNSIILKMK